MSYSEFASMSTGEFIFVFSKLLIFTIICYCTIPIIFRFTLIKKKKLSKGHIKAIVIINAIVIFLTIHIIDLIISGENYGSLSLAPAFVWSCVNYSILSSGNKKHSDTTDTANDTNNKIILDDSTLSTVTDTFKEKKTLDIEEDISTDCIKNNKKIKDIIHTENKSSSKKIIVTLSCICALLFISTISVSVFAYSLFCEKEKYIAVSENAKTDGYNRGYSAGHNDGYDDGYESCLQRLGEMGVINY